MTDVDIRPKLPLPPWWDVLGAHGLLNPLSTAQERAIDQLVTSPLRVREAFVSDIVMSSLASDSPLKKRDIDAALLAGDVADGLTFNYDDLIGAARRPMLRYIGAWSDPYMLAGCLTYETVVVGDPFWFWTYWGDLLPDPGSAGFHDRDRLTGFALNYWLKKVVAPLVPLATAGFLTFDSLYGPASSVGSLSAELNRNLAQEGRRVKALWAAETVWATARAKTWAMAVGTGDQEYGDILALLMRPTPELERAVEAVEVSVVLPYVEHLTPASLVKLRAVNEEGLAAFRAALYSLTRELQHLSPESLSASRVREAIKDHLDSQLVALRREWRTIRLLRQAGVGAGALSLTTASLGVLHGSVSVDAVTPIVAGSLGLAAALNAWSHERVRVKSNAFYVLWNATTNKGV